MLANKLLHTQLRKSCPDINLKRLNCLLDVSEGLQKCRNMSPTAIGRAMPGSDQKKHRVKRVDRLLGNGKLVSETDKIYKATSRLILSHISQNKDLPVIIDVCFLKDDRQIQMLSAELANKGRSIPLYRDVFKEGQLKNRAQHFIQHLKECIPQGHDVIIIMDAGFFEDWFEAIENTGWHWLCRIRSGRSLYIDSIGNWMPINEYFKTVKTKIKEHENVLLTRRHKHQCRLVSIRKKAKGRHCKTKRGLNSNRVASMRFSQGAKEPWVLATNLPQKYAAMKIINLYRKRMQIEESFRDVKSHQFGISGRYIRSKDIRRWRVHMLLATLVQINYWIIGVLAHRQGLQRRYQVNSKYNEKVFSDFYLGCLVVEHGDLHLINRESPPDLHNLLREIVSHVV